MIARVQKTVKDDKTLERTGTIEQIVTLGGD